MASDNSYSEKGLPQALDLVEMVLAEDLEGLRRENYEMKIEWWNELAAAWRQFQRHWPSDWGENLRNTVRSKFKLAQLLVASSFVEGDDSPSVIVTGFSVDEEALLRDFEEYKALDILSVDDIVDRTHRRVGGIHELVTDFYLKQYEEIDAILENTGIQRDLMLGFKDRYQGRQEKIKEAVKAYVDKYGPADLEVLRAESRPTTVMNIHGDVHGNVFQGENARDDSFSVDITRGSQSQPSDPSASGPFCIRCGNEVDLPEPSELCSSCDKPVDNRS